MLLQRLHTGGLSVDRIVNTGHWKSDADKGYIRKCHNDVCADACLLFPFFIGAAVHIWATALYTGLASALTSLDWGAISVFLPM